MKNTEKQMECRNCVHYLEHFVKSKDRFSLCLHGHCTNRSQADTSAKQTKFASALNKLIGQQKNKNGLQKS